MRVSERRIVGRPGICWTAYKQHAGMSGILWIRRIRSPVADTRGASRRPSSLQAGAYAGCSSERTGLYVVVLVGSEAPRLFVEQNRRAGKRNVPNIDRVQVLSRVLPGKDVASRVERDVAGGR